jgi:putative endonuclease
MKILRGPDRIQTGKQGEDLAVAYLKKKGYAVLERNYRCVFGEVDIVAKDKEVIVFVEVKSRRSERFGEPQTAVDLEKQKKLSRISLKYLQDRRLYPCNARFDVVAVSILPDGGRIELIRNAFELAFG